jgi:hypothetical protein
MENSFGQPQSVIVLGGSSDIARALTKRLCAARAHTVVLCGRNQQLLDESAEEAKDYGASRTDTVLFDAEDVTNAAHVVSDAFEKAGGDVDLVVVAVGLLGDQLAQENDATAAGTVAVVNFAWPVAALAEVRRRLVAQEYGRILVMSSVAAIRIRRNAYLYGGAKAGGRANPDDEGPGAPSLHDRSRRSRRLRDEGTGDQRPGYLESTDPALRLCDVAPSPQADLAQGRRALTRRGRGARGRGGDGLAQFVVAKRHGEEIVRPE